MPFSSALEAELLHEWYEETQTLNYHTGQFSIFSGDIYFLDAPTFLEFVQEQFPLLNCNFTHLFEDGGANVSCANDAGVSVEHTGISYTELPKTITGCRYQSVAGVINLEGTCQCSQSEFHSLDTEIRECVIDPNLIDDNPDPEECQPSYEQCEAMCFNTTRCTYPSTMDNCSSYVVQDYHDGLPPEPYIEQQCNNLSDYDDYYYYEEFDCHDAYDYGDIDDYELDQCLDYVYRVEDCDQQFGIWEEWNEQAESICPQNIDPVLPQQEYIDYCDSEYLTIVEGYYTTRYTEDYAPCMGTRSNHCWLQRAEHILEYNCPTCDCKGDLEEESDWSAVVNSVNNNTDKKINNLQAYNDIKELKTNARYDFLLWRSNYDVSESELTNAFTSVTMQAGASGKKGEDASTAGYDTKIITTNTIIDQYIANQEIEDTPTNTLEITDIEHKQTFKQRINAIPIVNALTTLTINSTCNFEGTDITFIGATFDLNYNKICELSSSYKDTFGAFSLLMFSLFSVRVLGRT